MTEPAKQTGPTSQAGPQLPAADGSTDPHQWLEEVTGDEALAWVRDRPGVVAPIVGARDKNQLAGSLAAENLTLPAAIKAALDDAQRRVEPMMRG